MHINWIWWEIENIEMEYFQINIVCILNEVVLFLCVFAFWRQLRYSILDIFICIWKTVWMLMVFYFEKCMSALISIKYHVLFSLNNNFKQICCSCKRISGLDADLKVNKLCISSAGEGSWPFSWIAGWNHFAGWLSTGQQTEKKLNLTEVNRPAHLEQF